MRNDRIARSLRRRLRPMVVGLLAALTLLAASFGAAAAQDLEATFETWRAADEAAWIQRNVGDADAIAEAEGLRRAAEGRLFAAFDTWLAARTPPGPLRPAIETTLLARREGRDAVARRALERLADAVPAAHEDYGLLRLVAGQLFRDAGRVDLALPEFARAAAAVDFPARDVAFVALAELEEQRGDTARAAAAWRDLLAVEPVSLRADRARMWLAANDVALGRYEPALAWLATPVANAPSGETGARLWRVYARALAGAGRDLEARKSWLHLLEAFPTTRAARDGWTDLVAWLERRGDGTTPAERLAGGNVLLRGGDETRGLALLRPLRAAGTPAPLRVAAAEKEASWLYGRKRWSDARPVFAFAAEAAAGLPDRRADALLNVARCWRNVGATAEMAAAFDVVAADTTHPAFAARALWEMAKEYRSLARFADCERVLSRYIAGHPFGEDILGAYQVRGLCRRILGRHADSDADFRELAKRATRRADREAAAFWQARARLALRDTTGAVEALKAGTAWAMPDNYYGHRVYDLMEELGVPEAANRWRPRPTYDANRNPFAPAGLDRIAERPRHQFLRGLALARGGFTAEAAADLNRAADMAPEDPTLHDVNAMIGLRLGLYTFAMQSARRALARASDPGDEARLWRYVYALGYHDLILPAAEKRGLDPMLVTGLIRRESLFDERALSRAGARGLMQIMLPTARTLARQRHEPLPDESDLFRPEFSVEYGTDYLRRKIDEFDGRIEVALAAYNAGERKAAEWRALLPEWDPDLFMELIDYNETRDYVRIVRYHQDTYRLFYGHGSGIGGTDDPAR
jgi:soluble lytic murein transglycosylase-like protein